MVVHVDYQSSLRLAQQGKECLSDEVDAFDIRSEGFGEIVSINAAIRQVGCITSFPLPPR